LENLKKAIKEGNLSAADRVGLVNDAFALAYSGNSSTSQALSLLLAFGGEENSVVWEEISSSLSNLRSVYYEQPAETQDRLKKMLLHLFVPIARKLGWEAQKNEDPNTTILRTV